ncbi:MAG: ParM/StbA family protein [Pseudomonadota bacterium]|nr:ParM/StbA family protein [Pseudomonadota bacterium]
MSNLKSKQNIKCVGVDDGHSNTKVFAGYDSAGKPIQEIIQSVVRKGSTSFTTVDEKELEDATIMLDGEIYTVGSKYAGQGDDLVYDGYPVSGKNVALITQSLRRFVERWGKKPVDLSIVTGLPLGHYFDNAQDAVNDELINKKVANVERIEKAFSPADNNESMFTVVCNSVQPEGWGSFLDLILDERAEPTERFDIVKDYGTVIVDIGGRTVDTMVVKANVMTAVYRDIHTYDLGILYLYRDIVGFIMQKENLREAPTRDKIDALIRTGKWGRRDRDYSSVIKQIIDRFVDDIFGSIKAVVSREEAEGGVVVTGGGAELLGDYLKQRIEEYNDKAEVIIPEHPVFSNARGFWKKSVSNKLDYEAKVAKGLVKSDKKG